VELTSDDGILVFVGIALLILTLALSNIGFYHYGYYEGKTAILESIRPKPEPAK
jgi:hypothetical protein